MGNDWFPYFLNTKTTVNTDKPYFQHLQRQPLRGNTKYGDLRQDRRRTTLKMKDGTKKAQKKTKIQRKCRNCYFLKLLCFFGFWVLGYMGFSYTVPITHNNRNTKRKSTNTKKNTTPRTKKTQNSSCILFGSLVVCLLVSDWGFGKHVRPHEYRPTKTHKYQSCSFSADRFFFVVFLSSVEWLQLAESRA